MTSLEIARWLAEQLDGDGPPIGRMETYLDVVVLETSTGYTSVEVGGIVVWDDQDECEPPDETGETPETALAHAVKVLLDLSAAFAERAQAAVAKIEAKED